MRKIWPMQGFPIRSASHTIGKSPAAQLIGDETGMLKLLFHRHTRALLGVHAIGEGATELIHIGQAVMAYQGKIDYFIDTVFNYPTLAECYKVAALDGINRLPRPWPQPTADVKR